MLQPGLQHVPETHCLGPVKRSEQMIALPPQIRQKPHRMNHREWGRSWAALGGRIWTNNGANTKGRREGRPGASPSPVQRSFGGQTWSGAVVKCGSRQSGFGPKSARSGSISTDVRRVRHFGRIWPSSTRCGSISTDFGRLYPYPARIRPNLGRFLTEFGQTLAKFGPTSATCGKGSPRFGRSCSTLGRPRHNFGRSRPEFGRTFGWPTCGNQPSTAGFLDNLLADDAVRGIQRGAKRARHAARAEAHSDPRGEQGSARPCTKAPCDVRAAGMRSAGLDAELASRAGGATALDPCRRINEGPTKTSTSRWSGVNGWCGKARFGLRARLGGGVLAVERGHTQTPQAIFRKA